MRRPGLKQVIVFVVTDDLPLFRSEFLDVFYEDFFHLIISAVNLGEVKAREMSSKFLKEGRVFKIVCHSNCPYWFALQI
jgi:hypothetical protein